MPSNKFHGIVGFRMSVETRPGYFEQKSVEKVYWGDIKWMNAKNDQGTTINGKVRVNNSIEIVANDFAFENFPFIEYVVWRGQKWQVSNVEIQPHRLALTIGGIYNGK